MAKVQSRKTAPRKSKSLKRVAASSAVSKHAGRQVATKTKTAIRDTISNNRAEAAAVKSVSAGRAGSKQAQMLAMLRGSAGTTIEAIMLATGWQAHSVRGFFAGVVRKKLGLALTSDVEEYGRVYRVSGNAASLASASSKTRIAA